MQGYRYEQRKKKRVNRILNVAIGIVTILIIVFAVQIFFSSTSSEEVLTEVDQNGEIEENEPESIADPVEKNKENNQSEAVEENEHESTEEQLDEEELEPVPDGEWEPVGTSQTGEFTPDFNEGSTNWNEMVKALQYATGIDDMIVWWIGNGGSATRARGEVAPRGNPNEKYEVYIEWIDGQGWMPVEKNKLN
ncbi:YrrS family protein [Halalkalibacter kiskunsagensis]|uniref:YrrS family protein n=1 Tax=Halalkalibacter kiskunsagensis TaxID=1548599 RepID=A0ABV6KJV3_9BACI